METELKSSIRPKQAGVSVLEHLCARFRYLRREEWEARIADGRVTLNGARVAPGRVLQTHDLLSYRTVLREPEVPTDIRLLHEEDAFVVAYKPGGLPSHADGNFITRTFIAMLNKMLDPRRPAKLVHRLDRETSGVMVAARDPEAHRRLTRLFETGGIRKEYLAVGKGRAPRPAFEVRGAIARDPESAVSIRHRLFPEGHPGGKDSLTAFEVLRQADACCLLRCLPRTGRTNQIRIHLDSVGLPIVGDKLYGRTDAEFLAFVAHVKAGGHPGFCPPMEVPRHFLHAHRIAFAHPLTGSPVEFESPMPGDMADYMARA